MGRPGSTPRSSCWRPGYLGGGHKTLNSILQKYAPSSDNNNPASYAGTVAGLTGLDPNAPLTEAQLPAVARAMAAVESGKPMSKIDSIFGLNGAPGHDDQFRPHGSFGHSARGGRAASARSRGSSPHACAAG